MESLLRDQVATSIHPKDPSPIANAERVLNDITCGKVFDDILVDYEAVLTSCFSTLGYSPDQLLNNVVLPSFEDAESVAEDLK